MTDKPKRSVPFIFRVTPEEKNIMDDAARYEGLPTGTWLRQLALHAAREILRKITGAT